MLKRLILLLLTSLSINTLAQEQQTTLWGMSEVEVIQASGRSPDNIVKNEMWNALIYEVQDNQNINRNVYTFIDEKLRRIEKFTILKKAGMKAVPDLAEQMFQYYDAMIEQATQELGPPSGLPKHVWRLESMKGSDKYPSKQDIMQQKADYIIKWLQREKGFHLGLRLSASQEGLILVIEEEDPDYMKYVFNKMPLQLPRNSATNNKPTTSSKTDKNWQSKYIPKEVGSVEFGMSVSEFKLKNPAKKLIERNSSSTSFRKVLMEESAPGGFKNLVYYFGLDGTGPLYEIIMEYPDNVNIKAKAQSLYGKPNNG